MPEQVLGGRYRIQGKIGIGGMATVYRGTDEVLGRTVAIKTMLPQYAADPSFAARFKQEAQAAAALQSPYIVSIFDWGKEGDTYYIIMEYLRGTDLKSGIRSHGALDSRKVAQIGSQICQALSVAHKHDIIHRDIKPQNIMVQPDGNIKVMDFGIARAKNSHLTADNSVLGTAHYVSPEQTQGKPLGPTSDIYSLGIVMYEAATGKVPFDGDDAISVALKQVNEQPVPPSQINPDVDPALEAIILTCMAKDPGARFQTADELRRALTDFLAGRVVNIASNGTTQMMAATSRIKPGANGATQAIKPVTPRSGSTRVQTQVPQDEEPEEEKRSGRKVGVVIGVLAAIAAIAAVVYFVATGTPSSQMVPNFTNKPQDEAVAAIEATNYFQVGNVSEQYSDTVDKGVVISQDPEAGTLQSKDTKINLVVSKGEKPAEEVTVPDLVNKSSTEAQQALAKAGLKGDAQTKPSDTVAKGYVCEQSPAAGTTAKEGDTVTYYISTGTEAVDVPDVQGYSQSSATTILQNAGFSVSVSDQQYSDSYSEGTVISYSPNGSQAKGTTIYLIVSLGPKPEENTNNTPTTPSTNGSGNEGGSGNTGGNGGTGGSGNPSGGGDTGSGGDAGDSGDPNTEGRANS